MLVGAPLVATPKADPRSEPAWLDAAAIAVIDRLLSTRPSQKILRTEGSLKLHDNGFRKGSAPIL